MGAILACLPRQELWLSCGARAQPIRVLQLRIKQDLLFDLQGVMSMRAQSLGKVDPKCFQNTRARLNWLKRLLKYNMRLFGQFKCQNYANAKARNHNRVNHLLKHLVWGSNIYELDDKWYLNQHLKFGEIQVGKQLAGLWAKALMA